MNIKRKTTLIVLSIIVALSAIHAGASIYWSRRSLAEGKIENRRLFERNYELLTNRLDNYLSTRMNGLLVQDEILHAFRDRDREKLYSLTKKKFQVMNKELPGFPILHFHTPDHKSFLRVHMPGKFADDLERVRPMITDVTHFRIEKKGFEAGKFAILYRIVRPIFHEGEFLGVLEIGGDIGFLMRELRLLFNLPSAFFVTENSLTSYQMNKKFRKVSGRLLFSSNYDQIFDSIDSIDFLHGGKKMIGGREYELLVSDPILNPDGELLGNIVSLQDLSRENVLLRNIIIQTVVMSFLLLILVSIVLEKSLGRMVSDLEESNRRATHAEKAKGDFLANMSHEIRTPMNAIVGMTNLALKTPLSTRQQFLVGSVKTASDSLLGLLNDILDFSKIEAGQLQFDVHAFSVSALVDSVKSIMAIAVADKGLTLNVQADFEQLPEFVDGDELRLRQVLVNLVNNAVKFTECGTVTIRVAQEEASSDSVTSRLRFSVIDTGIGISADQQSSVFTSFRQADSSTARQFGGTGLGLAICKQLVEIMGGRLWFESMEGKGSCFHFTVLLPVADGMLIKQNEQPIAALVRHLRILVVEDNVANRDLARMVFESDGHSVVTAVDGMDALKKLAIRNFDVVVMDVQMPVMDGYAASQIIRDCEQGGTENVNVPLELSEQLTNRLADGHLVIVAMTANAMQGDKEKCLQAGMDDYITKPFLPDQVASVLSRVTEFNGNPPA